jgi:hypothetical protein
MTYRNKSLPTFDGTGNANPSMNVNIVSQFIDIRNTSGFSFQCVWTGAPVGALRIEVTNMEPSPASLWEPMPNSNIAVSGAGSQIFDVGECFVGWARISWISTSGTGTIQIYHVVKDL